MKQRTGAKLMVSDADADMIERGGHGDFSLGDSATFPAARVDRRLHDGDTVRLGAATLTAHVTPGHTRGCTTWTFDVIDKGRTMHVVDVCGLTILKDTKVSGMPAYPDIAADYVRTFAALRALPVDIFVGAHASYYDGMAKARAARQSGGATNPFVDPDGYRRFIAGAEAKFNAQLAVERK
jgi:metallo-beta-lactamase class B